MFKGSHPIPILARNRFIRLAILVRDVPAIENSIFSFGKVEIEGPRHSEVDFSTSNAAKKSCLLYVTGRISIVSACAISYN